MLAPAFVAAAMLWGNLALADEPKHGGQVKKFGAYEAELVVKGRDVRLYVIKGHRPARPAADMTATVRLFAHNAETDVDLTPQGDLVAAMASTPLSGKVGAMAILRQGGNEL